MLSERLKRWNKSLAIAFAVIAFSVLITIGIYKEIENDYQSDHNTNFSSNYGKLTCAFELIGTNITNIDRILKEQLANRKDCKQHQFHLDLINITFPENKINEIQLELNGGIESLCIIANQHVIMSEKALSNNAFHQLISLQLSNVTIFNGNTPSTINVSGLDNQLLKNLIKLKVHHSSHSNVQEIIGRIALPQLMTLDLSNNPIGNTLNRFTFVNVTNVRKLFLANCMIEHLEPDTFYFLRFHIKLIDLQSNRLINLPPGFSESLIPAINSMTLHLNNNPWSCNCQSHSHLSTLLNEIECLENCYETSTTTSVTNSLNKKELKNDSQIKNYEFSTVDIECIDYMDYEVVDIVTVNCQLHNMVIHAVDEKTLKIKFKDPLPNFILLWFNDSMLMTAQDYEMSTNDLNCINLANQINYINNLTAGLTYTFCILDSSTSTVSPFNCVAYYLAGNIDDEENPIWISNEQKTFTIFIVFGLILIFVWFGLMLGIWLIRRNPNWLKGAKNVVVVKSERKCNTNNNINRASNDPSVEDNNVIDYRPCVQQRRYTDSSIKGYEIALNPSRFDIIKSRLETSHGHYDNKYYMEDLPKSPPPEPPKCDSNNQQNDGDVPFYVATVQQPCYDDINLDKLYAKCGEYKLKKLADDMTQ